MYLRILKKDLKRKKTMNVILLVFITLAAAFVASSVNNIISVFHALDSYFEKANVPDYWFAITEEKEKERFNEFAEENAYQYDTMKLLQIPSKNIFVEGEEMDYPNPACLSTLGKIKVFDSNSEEITEIKDGEIYVNSDVFHSEENDYKVGGTIVIQFNGVEKEFTIKGYSKDALLGSSMMGMTRFLVSENDYELFYSEDAVSYDSVAVYTEDSSYQEKFDALELNTVFHMDYDSIKMMYFMEMLIAAIMLIVSICLILISMVILHFTVHFTIGEEFREIGVMKAIGISKGCIRGLYIAKYFAISMVGAILGLVLSIPFGNLLLEKVSRNIVISGNDNVIMNVICAVGTAAVVVCFSYFCTRKIKKFSPIDAIRNGESGERYKRKGIIHLSKTKAPAVLFMAGNDILSGLKKYISMIVIFTLGILLIIIPLNAIYTLQSDSLLSWFNMAKSHHVISQELLTSMDENSEKVLSDKLEEVKTALSNNNIDADVFQEVMFRMNISYEDRKMSSLAFLGIGGVTTDMYDYIEGTPPQNNHEVAISRVVAEKIGANIGDDVEINIGDETRTYTVTAINESLSNMGEGIRFYQEEELDLSKSIGCYAIQINYKDNPNKKTLNERMELLKELYPAEKIFTGAEYISYMMGDIAGQLQGVKSMILMVVLCINMLVAVLMVKSFVTKEKSEIAILKAIGFKNSSLILWQSVRIGLVLLISVLLGILLAIPLSDGLIGMVFGMLGAKSVEIQTNALEAYVIYPLIVLGVTSVAAFISAQGLRKIPASDCSNME